MLRPSNGLLGSSRAARRANLRAERVKALAHVVRGLRGLVRGVIALAVDLVLLWALPFLYLTAAYFAVDLPARWLFHRGAWGTMGLLIFIGSSVMSLIGIARAVQDATPIAPVRPRFAKSMLALSWLTALILTIGDLAS